MSLRRRWLEATFVAQLLGLFTVAVLLAFTPTTAVAGGLPLVCATDCSCVQGTQLCGAVLSACRLSCRCAVDSSGGTSCV